MTANQDSLRDYYLFWSGQQISAAGSAIISFVIIWWITITTQSALYLALSSVLSFGSMMAVQFISGYLTDYCNRKWIIAVVDGGQALLTLILVFRFWEGTETIVLVLVILALRGLLDGLHRPATGAIIPVMVPPESLQRVNSHNSTARSAINLSSPLIAAVLFGVFSDRIWMLLLLDGITYLIAVIPLSMITIPPVTRSSDGETLVQKLVGGFRFLRTSSGLLPLLFIFASFNFFLTPVSMLTPLIIYSSSGFGASETIFAVTIAATNVGMLSMSIVLSRTDRELPSTTGVVFGFLISITGLGLLCLSLLRSSLVLFICSNFVIGLGFPVVNVYSGIIWQTRVPRDLQGRVISVRLIVTMASLPVSMIAMGVFAELVSFFLLYLLSTLGFTTLLAIIWVFTDFRDCDQTQLSMTTSPLPQLAAD